MDNPPHVYCERGEAKFWLQPDIELAQNHGLSDRDIRTAEGLIEEHTSSAGAQSCFEVQAERRVNMDRYEIIIFWSDEDAAFVADVPELPGCMAHGNTHEDALRNARKAIKLWIKTAKEFGDPIPVPKGRRLVFA